MLRLASARVLALSLILAGCAPATAPVHAEAKLRAPAAPKPSLPRERLVQALRSIPRPLPVLAALPESAQEQLRVRYSALDAERKLSIHRDDSPLVETLPLLHLVSGGASPRALYALATTPAGSRELAGLLGVVPDAERRSPDLVRVALVREIAERAALNFLRDRAADVAQVGKGTPLVCRLVARAALALERRDLVLLARELLASAEPDPENTLELAREWARAGDPGRAADELSRALADARHAPRSESLAETRELIEVSRVATAPVAGSDVEDRLRRARAWLRLGRPAEARALLEEQTQVAKSRLDLAAAVAETMIEKPSCPNLPLDVGSAALCAVAFRSSERVKAARELLDAAWQSGGGRDDEAIEVYAGLSQVIPWMHETAKDISEGTLSPQDGALRVAAFLQKLREITAVAPRLEGIALFLETVHSGPAQQVSGLRSAADAEALSARALSLAGTERNRFTQAAVLAVAAALSHQRDTSPLLDAIPERTTAAALRVPRAALAVWVAASGGAPERMDSARSELAQIMSEGQGSSFDRARLVLSVSEADALLAESERSYQLLSRVAGQLLNDDIPPELALRAVLDAAGALAHGGRFEQALQILDSAASAELPPERSQARDLLQLIRGYRVVLGARAAPVSTLPRVRADLAAELTEANGESTRVWFELWSRELDALQQDADCAKRKLPVCRSAQALRREARRDWDARLGARASSVLSRGALPAGSFDAGFRFTIEKGLEPLVVYDPSFLSIGLPKPQ